MKRILLVISLLLTSLYIAKAQTVDSQLKDSPQLLSHDLADRDGDKIIPLSMEQAEKLATEIAYHIINQRARTAQAKLDAKVMEVKIEALKRKMIDEALAKQYNSDLNQRLSKLEQLLYLLVLSNSKGGDISPQLLHALTPQGGASAPIILSQSKSQPVAETLREKLVVQKDTVAGTLLDTKSQDLFQAGVTSTLDSLVYLLSGVEQSAPVVEEVAKEKADFHFQVFFNVGQSNITESNTKIMRSTVDYLLANPQIRVQLTGYASPEGSVNRNNILARERVEAVYNYLLKNGITADRMNVNIGGVNSVTTTRAEARRVDILPYIN